MNVLLAALLLTKTATISESATLVPGNTFSAYLVNGEIVTSLKNSDYSTPQLLGGIAPVVQISFPTERVWHIVKHATWDRAHHRITIDF